MIHPRPARDVLEMKVANNVLLVGVLGAMGWLFVSAVPPLKPVERSAAAQAAVHDSAAAPYPSASQGPVIVKHQDPVPLVRNVPAPAASPTVPARSETSTSAAPEDRQTPDDLDRKAARLAAELDGYKRVSILGRADNGAWRAKGYRGATEVLLTVDGTGRVSLD